jgi:hypothetical protein
MSFVRGDFKRSLFTKLLYHHLIQHFGFIAHYDINGFYNTYFITPEGTESFIYCIKNNHHMKEYDDVNSVIKLILNQHKDRIIYECNKKIVDRDIKLAKALLNFHDIQYEIKE